MSPRPSPLLLLVLAACGGEAPRRTVTDIPQDTPLRGATAEEVARFREGDALFDGAFRAPDGDGRARPRITAASRVSRDARRPHRSSHSALSCIPEGPHPVTLPRSLSLAVLFPDLDASTDGRCDDSALTAPDANLFDGRGFTGVHAVERILWSDSVPAPVTRFESALLGDEAPRFSANTTEAQDFRDELLGKLLQDCSRDRKSVV